MTKAAWVLIQVTWSDPPVYVGVLPWEQFTRDVRRAKRFKDRRDAEDYRDEICVHWPHKPTVAAVTIEEDT